MKKIFIILLAAISTDAMATSATMTNSGYFVAANFTANPNSVDTLIIPVGKIAEFNGTTTLLNVKAIQLYGTLSPSTATSGGADILTIDTNAIINIFSTGVVTNIMGNQANHAIMFGNVCVWGKKCCTGNNTVYGVDKITSTNPCNPIVLNMGEDIKTTQAKIQDITDRNGDVTIIMQDAENITARVVSISSGKFRTYFVEGNTITITASQNEMLFIEAKDNNQNIVKHKTIKL
jgi:hypothetical protein